MNYWILFVLKRDSTRRLILASRYDDVWSAINAGLSWERRGYTYRVDRH